MSDLDTAASTEVTETADIDINSIFKNDESDESGNVPSEIHEKPAEPVVDEAKKAAEEKSAARFAALARQEKQLRSEREALKREKAEVENAKVKWSKIGQAPLDVIKENGLDPEEFVNRVLNDGKPSTEHVVAQLQKQIEEMKAERQALAEAQEAAKYEQAVGAAKTEFATYVEDAAEKFPLLYEFDPVQIGEAGWKIAHDLAEELERSPSQDEIAQRLEENLTAIQKAREERRAKLLAKKQPVQAAKVEPTKKAIPKTLSNSDTSEKSTVVRELTPEEIDEESLRILRAHGWR